jgi:hypothetical protein
VAARRGWCDSDQVRARDWYLFVEATTTLAGALLALPAVVLTVVAFGGPAHGSRTYDRVAVVVAFALAVLVPGASVPLTLAIAVGLFASYRLLMRLAGRLSLR